MVYRRRKAVRRYRKRAAPRRRVPRGPISLTVRRHCFIQTITQNSVIEYGVMTFRLDQLPNSAEFTSLFEMFKITRIKLRFQPSYNDSTAGAAAASRLPIFHCSKDHDDIAFPTSVDQLYQYDSYRQFRTDRPWTIVLKPKVLPLIYGTALVNSYGVAANTWVSCDNPATNHYGLKYAMDLGAVNTAITVKVFAQFTVKLKSQR